MAAGGKIAADGLLGKNHTDRRCAPSLEDRRAAEGRRRLAHSLLVLSAKECATSQTGVSI